MFVIRPISPEDSFESLTELLHRAYGILAEQGIRFFASHQSVEETRKRAGAGTCFVAEQDGVVIGTITAYAGHPGWECEWYRDLNNWHFGQFAVEPALQQQGIGNALLKHAEQFAKEQGATSMACDTAEPAAGLIRYYQSRGYQFIGHVQWDVVNYRSVVLMKSFLS